MKIKASKLLKELLANSQKAFDSEDKNIQSAINDIIDFATIPDYETILKIINLNNEYLRASIIKTVLSTLIQNGVLENDIKSDNVSNIKAAYESSLNI